MRLRSIALSLVVAGVSTVALAASEANNFIMVSTAGKPIGKATYTVDKAGSGYKVRSRFEYRVTLSMPGADDAVKDPSNPAAGGGGGMVKDAQISFEYQVDGNGDFASGFTRDASTQMLTSFQLDKTRTNIMIGQMQGGVNLGGRTLVAPKPDYLVVPDYDPSALQMLVYSAKDHPRDDKTYLLIVPGARGTNAVYVTVQKDTDTPTGTLDGKPVTLVHYKLGYTKSHADLYTDADGKLMEADMGGLGTNLVRAKFALSK